MRFSTLTNTAGHKIAKVLIAFIIIEYKNLRAILIFDFSRYICFTYQKDSPPPSGLQPECPTWLTPETNKLLIKFHSKYRKLDCIVFILAPEVIRIISWVNPTPWNASLTLGFDSWEGEFFWHLKQIYLLRSKIQICLKFFLF